MAFWRATDVDLPQNSAIVTVNTGDDVGSITSGYIIQINAGQFLEVKTVNTGASPQTIELYQIYTGTAITGGTAIAAPTQGAIKEATEELRNLRTTYETLADSVSSTATANSLVKRNGSAQVLVADATANNHAVAFGQLGTAASKDVTTSRYDTATGRLLKSGDVGLLSSSAPNAAEFNAADDLDLLTSGGFWSFGSASNGKPYNGGGSLIVAPITTDRTLQIGNEHNNSNIGFRYRSEFGAYPGVFSPWYDFYHSGNTNFNEFGGASDGRMVLTGNIVSSTLARFFRPHQGASPPTGIDNHTGTFRVDIIGGANRIQTGQPTLSAGLSGLGMAIIEVAISGGSVGDDVLLRCDGGAAYSKITN